MEKLENWKQRPLSQVVSRWIRGTTLNRSKTDYYTKTPQPESLPWARVGDIKEEYISQTENYLTKGRCAALCIRNDWKSGYCRLRHDGEPGNTGNGFR